MLNLIIACILAGILGFAAHRASICTVRAVAELSYSRTGYMLGSIVKSALWVFAITIPVFLLVPQSRERPHRLAADLHGHVRRAAVRHRGRRQRRLRLRDHGAHGRWRDRHVAHRRGIRTRRADLRRAARHRHAGPPRGGTEPGARRDACRTLYRRRSADARALRVGADLAQPSARLDAARPCPRARLSPVRPQRS